MKKIFISVLPTLIICLFFTVTYAANRYSVADGLWRSTSTWSATSGGASGASVPVAGDSVFILGGWTVTIDANAACTSLIVGPSSSGNLYISNNGSVAITVSGDVNVNNGMMRVTNAPGNRTHTLLIGGNLTVTLLSYFNMISQDGSDVCNINFNGTTPQTLYGAGTTTLNNVTLNNATGLTLLNGETIGGNLTLTSGKLDLNGFGLNVLGSINSSTPSQNYIITGTAGSNLTSSANTTTTLFPIGTSTNYLPISLTTASGTINYTVFIYEGATINGVQGGPSISSKSFIVDAVYNVTASVATSTTVHVGWTAALEGTSFATLADASIGISDYSSGIWKAAQQDIGTASNSGNVVDRTLTIPTTNLPLGVALLNAALPITLYNFGAIVKGNTVQIDWKANSTSINASFDVERSSTGTGFAKLGTVNAKGIGDFNYQFFDNTPVAATNFYRLKIINETGKVSYSKTVAVQMGTKTFAINNVFPTVATDNITLAIGSSELRQAQLSIVDMNGRLVSNKTLTINSGNLTYPVNISTLSAGNYILLLKSGDQQLQTRFIKR